MSTHTVFHETCVYARQSTYKQQTDQNILNHTLNLDYGVFYFKGARLDKPRMKNSFNHLVYLTQ